MTRENESENQMSNQRTTTLDRNTGNAEATATRIATEPLGECGLGLPTLDRRNMDGLDFHEISVWDLKAALVAAYDAGRLEATIAAKKS